MPTSKENLKPYTHFWLHTNAGDHYLGQIASAVLDKSNNLQLTTAPMVRVEPSEHNDVKWRLVDKKPSYAFTFESCLHNGTNPTNGIRFISALKDEIILSLDETNKRILDELLTEDV